ncbi:MAG: GntR family transcriptional regulator [Ruminiclostridium sp.]|nr:GntR family transcriptional regulator [Ruminiclostridium sp.]
MINKYSSVPLYSQLKTLIIDKIETGEYGEETKIPSEQELCEQYDISRPTVRQAVSELTSSGYLYKEKGKGTFVAKTKSKIDIKSFTGFTDSILDSQEPGQHNIISLRSINSSSLKCLEDIFVSSGSNNQQNNFAEIKYIVTQKNDVLSYNISYIPLGFFPGIIEDIKAKKPSYEILRGKYPLLPVKTKSTIEIVYTGQEDAQYLHVQTGNALIKIDNILYSKSGQVVEFVVAKYKADKCKLMFENNK